MKTISRRYFSMALFLLFLAITLGMAERLARQEASSGESHPFLDPPGGAYRHTVLLTIRPTHPGAPLVFTTDGSIPTASVGFLYRRPLRLDGGLPAVTVLRVREFHADRPGPLHTASYAVGPPLPLPILSLAVPPDDLLANLWTHREITAHVTLIEKEGPVSFALPVGLRVEESGDRPTFRLAFRQEYGTSRLEYPLFPTHFGDEPTYKRLLLSPGEWGDHWALLDEALPATLAAEMGLPTAWGKFVLLFLNGEPEGIYYLRERMDRFYLRDRLGIPDGDLVQDGRALVGDEQAWDTLIAWIASHDLSDPANMDALQQRVDLNKLADVAILQIYLNRHTLLAAHPRSDDGCWLWPYPPSEADDPTPPTTLSRLQSLLLESDAYRTLYLTRAADWLNTVLAPAAVGEQVEQLAAVLRPAISYQATRHPPGSPPDVTVLYPAEEWERNVTALHDFVRQRPDELRRQLIAEFELRGTTTITFGVRSPQGGSLLVNGRPVPTPVWQGIYFQGMPVQVVAVPAPGYGFVGWEGATDSSPVLTITVDGPRSLVAHFAPADTAAAAPNDVIFNEYWIDDNGTRYASLGGKGIWGDWVELRVARRAAVDLRGWRLTDNNTKTADDEGSLIFPSLDALAAIPRDAVILIIATENVTNSATFPADDLDADDGRLLFYVGNGHLDTSTDPGFGIGRGDEALVLLAPGATESLADDVGVDFVAEGGAVTPASFGVLADGVRFTAPFQGLGRDDGAVFTGQGSNDDGRVGWIVDPPSEQSGDVLRPGVPNALSPGAPNEGQPGPTVPAWPLIVAVLGGAAAFLLLRRRR